MNGISLNYHFGEPTLILTGIRSDLRFIYLFLFKEIPLNKQNNIRWDAALASHRQVSKSGPAMKRQRRFTRGLYCLPVSHKNDARLLILGNLYTGKMSPIGFRRYPIHWCNITSTITYRNTLVRFGAARGFVQFSWFFAWRDSVKQLKWNEDFFSICWAFPLICGVSL